jgi:hypothetical protein
MEFKVIQMNLTLTKQYISSMKNYRIYPIGSPAYVYHHGLSKIKNGKNPSAVLAAEFGGFKNPQLAFKLAKLLLEDTPNTLLGKPFLRSEIDWAKEQKNMKTI